MEENVKWIKFILGCTDGRSFKRMRYAQIGGQNFRDKLEAVWFELLDFAGQCNHDGALIDEREIPYKSIEDVACMLSRDPKELELCMGFYEKEGMIEIIDDIYMLSNYTKYQDTTFLTDKREYDRIKQRERRARLKKMADDVNLLSQSENSNDCDNVNDKPQNVNDKINDCQTLSLVFLSNNSNSNSLSNTYTISITELYVSIRELYKNYGYVGKANKNETLIRLKTILTNSAKGKRLYPLQIYFAYKAYLTEQSDKKTETQFIKATETFLTHKVYDYAEKTYPSFEANMVKKYGDDWKKVKFEYIA